MWENPELADPYNAAKPASDSDLSFHPWASHFYRRYPELHHPNEDQPNTAPANARLSRSHRRCRHRSAGPADVFVDARLIERETDVASAQLSFQDSDQLVTFIVMAPGYEPWIAQFQAGDDSTSINSTVKLIPKLPQAAAEPPVSGQTAARVGEAVLIFQSYIVDAKTKRPVIADVRLNGETVRWDITYLELEVPLDEEDFFQIKVVAPGYVPWMIEGRGHVNEDKRWQGPIQLVRQSSNPKASERPTF